MVTLLAIPKIPLGVHCLLDLKTRVEKEIMLGITIIQGFEMKTINIVKNIMTKAWIVENWVIYDNLELFSDNIYHNFV